MFVAKKEHNERRYDNNNNTIEWNKTNKRNDIELMEKCVN